MTRIQAYFPQELYDLALLEAKKKNQNFSQFLREIVDNYLQTKPHKIKKISKFKNLKIITLDRPIFEGLKPEEISKKIDEIVYD